MVSLLSMERMSDLPEGSPISPVPPPKSAMGLCPMRCICAIAMMGI